MPSRCPFPTYKKKKDQAFSRLWLWWLFLLPGVPAADAESSSFLSTCSLELPTKNFFPGTLETFGGPLRETADFTDFGDVNVDELKEEDV